MTPWQQGNLSRIQQQLDWLRQQPDGVILKRDKSDTCPDNLVIIKQQGQIVLYFAELSPGKKPKFSGIMSRIELDDPLNLAGIYAQAMLLTLAIVPDPQRVYMLGFAGGRVPMVLHHYYPHLQIDGSELNPELPIIAQRFFALPDDPRLNVHVGDGRAHLQQAPNGHYDIILIDCFTGAGEHPLPLATREFYQICQRALTANGVVATNLVETDPQFKSKARTFWHSFQHCYDFTDDGAHVLFGSPVPLPDIETLKQKAQQLQHQQQWPFSLQKRAAQTRSHLKRSFRAKVLMDANLA